MPNQPGVYKQSMAGWMGYKKWFMGLLLATLSKNKWVLTIQTPVFNMCRYLRGINTFGGAGQILKIIRAAAII
jgi:hypothetical protein